MGRAALARDGVANRRRAVSDDYGGAAAPGIAGRLEAALGVAPDRVDAAEEQIAGWPGNHLPGPVPERRAGARVEPLLQIGDAVLEVQARRRDRLGDRQVEVDQVSNTWRIAVRMRFDPPEPSAVIEPSER